jgi:amino acid transporter
MIQSLGEMICYAPIAGGYVHMAERYIHPSVGFALGWMQWYNHVVSLPTEIISATLIIGFWIEMTTARLAGFITLLLFLCASFNFLGVRWFGESEFWFAMIKISLILGLIIGGLAVDLGGGPSGDRIGFRYWKNPGAFAEHILPGAIGRFMGWFTTLLQAAYSFSGMEALAMTCAEVVNPRANMKKAVNRIFYRILFFYVFGITIVGMLVPSDDPDILQSTGTAASSPFVIAFNRAGVKVLPHIINAGVLTSAFSASNSGLYGSSRTIYGLSLRGQAPKILSKTTKSGLPIVALGFSVMWILLSYMSLSEGASTVLGWLSNLTSIAAFICWGTICTAFLRFKAGCEAQGIDRSASKFLYNKFQPYPAYWALFWCAIVVVFNGYPVFLSGGWNTSDFIISYINIPIWFCLFLPHYFYHGRQPFKKAHEIDMFSNVPGPEIDFDPNPPTTRLGRFGRWLF